MPTRLPIARSIIIAAMVAASAQAGDPPSLEVVGAWGGPVNAVAFDGHIACVGSGRRLVVLDVGDINNFIELGAIDLGNTVQDLAVRDGYAFVAARNGPNNFCIVDVSVPAKPAIAWSASGVSFFVAHSAWQVQLHGDYAYVRTDGGMAVLDVADPRSPSFLGHIFDAAGEINDFAIVGDLAYLASSTSPALSIYDLSIDAIDPLNPTPVGLLLLFDPAVSGGEMEHLAVADSYVYALAQYYSPGSSETRLAVIDVSNPRAPKLASDPIQFQSPYAPLDLAAEPGRLYLANGAHFISPVAWSNSPGLLIYDIALNPATPAFIKSYPTHGSIQNVQPAGTIAWLLDAGEGLIALDVTNPAVPLRRDNYHSPAHLKKMDKVGDRLYVTDLWNGFTILDVGNPAAPQVLGVYRTPMVLPPFGKGDPVNNGIYNWGIEVRDNRAYLAAGFAGIHVVNVANPATPFKIGGSAPALPDLVRATAIELDGDFAHVGISLGIGGLYNNYNITDVTNPIVLPLVGSVEIGTGPNTIATRQGYSYLAMGGYLTVINSTAPADPLAVSTATDLLPARDLAIADDLLHVAGGIDVEEGLHIYNLPQRDAPEFSGFYPSDFGCAVAVQDQRAYVVGSPGCLALDVSDPDQPQPLALASGVGMQSHGTVFVDEPYVFITRASGQMHLDRGLEILKLEGCLDSAGDADFNCDGIVNGFDLAQLLSQWTGSAFYSPCPPHLPADLSHDCRVNGGDLAILLGDWG